jgi:hypothetical protein
MVSVVESGAMLKEELFFRTQRSKEVKVIEEEKA